MLTRGATFTAVIDPPPQPENDGTRYLGTGLIRSGDQTMLVRGLARGLGWLVIALVRGLRYLYDAARYLRTRNR